MQISWSPAVSGPQHMNNVTCFPPDLMDWSGSSGSLVVCDMAYTILDK